MELGSVFIIITPNRHELPLMAEESGCMLGKAHQLIWQWPIAGELEVGASNQLVLTKISCPGGGDPYWFTAHDIPDDDKWGGNTQSMPSMKEHLATLQKPVAERAPVRVWQVLSFLFCSDWRSCPNKFGGEIKTKAVMSGQCWWACSDVCISEPVTLWMQEVAAWANTLGQGCGRGIQSLSRSALGTAWLSPIL